MSTWVKAIVPDELRSPLCLRSFTITLLYHTLWSTSMGRVTARVSATRPQVEPSVQRVFSELTPTRRHRLCLRKCWLSYRVGSQHSDMTRQDQP